VFRAVGLTAVVINAETPERSDMWARAGENGPRVLLLSPEQLISKRFEKLVNDSSFRRRVCLLAVDEVHLLDSWGNSFRKAYQQIQFVRARFELSLLVIAMTATLLPGDQTNRVCNFVGLRNYHTVQRSNRRPEIQLIFRVLSHGIESWEFSDLRWIIDDMQRKKTIIFCTSIRDGFRIFSYLWRLLDSPPHVRGDQLRMYNALNWPDYNLKTRELMRKQDGCRIIVATDILMVGIDFPDIDDVVIIGHPPHTNDYIQKIGRVGRDRALVSNPRGITYITGSAMMAAYEQLGVAKRPKPEKDVAKDVAKGAAKDTVKGAAKDAAKGAAKLDTAKDVAKGAAKKPAAKKPAAKKRKTTAKGITPKSSKSSVSQSMADLIVSDCKTSSLDRLYKNPPLGELPRCNCSGCAPEPETSKQRSKRGVRGLMKEMRETTTKRLVALRKKIFVEEVQSAVTDPFFVLPQVLPDELIANIVNALPELSYDTLRALVNDDEIMKTHVLKIWTIAVEIRMICEQQRNQRADEKAAKRKREPTDVDVRDTRCVLTIRATPSRYSHSFQSIQFPGEGGLETEEEEDPTDEAVAPSSCPTF